MIATRSARSYGAVVLMMLAAACAQSESAAPASSLDAQPADAQPSESTAVAAALVDRLVVAEPYTAQPYRRAFFGDDWIDADRDCHNTRAEVLMQETTVPVTFNPNGCTVKSGSWTDPWSGYTSTLASDFQIDHTVPLADAWRSGAWQWDADRRLAFANHFDDVDELNALLGSVNESKSDHAPDNWRPPLRSTWCAYATAWATIKWTWQLTVTADEQTALRTMIETCN